MDIIVGGHMRARVAKELGIETVPTVEVNLTRDRERELNIRLNRNVGQWDFDLLANNFEIDELTDWGFEPKELDFTAIPEDNEPINEDKLAETTNECPKCGFKW